MATFTPPQALLTIFSAEEKWVVRNAIANTVTVSTACFENVIKPLIDVDNRTQATLSVISMLRYASPNQATRDAADEAVRLMSESGSEFTARKDLYILVKAVKEKAETLHFEAAKELDNLLGDFTRCGHGSLNASQIKCYLDTRNEINNLIRKFNQNIRNQDEGLWFSLKELDGVSEQDLSRFKDSEEQEGMKFVRCNSANLSIIMKYARNPAARKKYFVMNANKLAQNVDLFKEIIIRRDENARLLGYASHAAFRIERRVAKSADWVVNFLDDFEKVIFPQGKQEMQVLLDRKKRYIAENTDYIQEYEDTMSRWDFRFYKNLLLEDLHIQYARISEYFPLQHTVSAMLQIFTSCLQLRFVAISLEPGSTWHEDVEAWSVWDERDISKGEFIGYLYSDILWRPNKYQGAQNVNLQCGYLKDDGTRIYPTTVLMCAFPRPTSSTCALLQHSDLVTLFHELGHGIHDLVSRTSYASFHGHSAPPDFAEAPSVMLEDWCWMKEELKRMSYHYTKLDPKYLKDWQEKHLGECASEKILDEMLHGLIKSRDIGRALWFLNQLAISRFDMAVHNPRSHEECVNLNPTELFNDLVERLYFLSSLGLESRGHPHVHFGHVVSGYDGGYYSDLSAHVFAADIFETTFAADPRSQTAWERYRRGILEPGGSRDELQMLEQFLGHSPSPEALLQSMSLLE